MTNCIVTHHQPHDKSHDASETHAETPGVYAPQVSIKLGAVCAQPCWLAQASKSPLLLLPLLHS